MIILWENRIPEISQKVVAPTLKTGTWYMKGLNLSAEVMIFCDFNINARN